MYSGGYLTILHNTHSLIQFIRCANKIATDEIIAERVKSRETDTETTNKKSY